MANKPEPTILSLLDEFIRDISRMPELLARDIAKGIADGLRDSHEEHDKEEEKEKLRRKWGGRDGWTG